MKRYWNKFLNWLLPNRRERLLAEITKRDQELALFDEWAKEQCKNFKTKEMKTPMQELIEVLKKEAQYISDNRRGLREAIQNAESMLEKEKEVMQDFATEYERQCRINLLRNIERCWEETFKTKER
jgi:hypothetical protein